MQLDESVKDFGSLLMGQCDNIPEASPSFPGSPNPPHHLYGLFFLFLGLSEPILHLSTEVKRSPGILPPRHPDLKCGEKKTPWVKKGVDRVRCFFPTDSDVQFLDLVPKLDSMIMST